MTTVWNWYSVSSRGKAQTGTTNDGADYGPDTTGTTTSGIQEAINAAEANNHQMPPGGPTSISLGDGTFSVTSQISIGSSMLPLGGIIMEGRGFGLTTIKANASMPSVITRATGGNNARITLADFGIDCNYSSSGGAGAAVDFTDSENDYEERIQNVEVQNYNTGLILDGNEGTTITGVIIENRASVGTGAAIQFKIPGGNAVIDKSYCSARVEIACQSFAIRDSYLSGVRFGFGSASQTARISGCHFQGPIPGTGNFIETGTSALLVELHVTGCYFDTSASASSQIVAGEYSSVLHFDHCVFNVPTGLTRTFLPNSTNLFSQGSPPYARVHIIGGEVEGGGNLLLTASPWTPGVVLAEVDDWNRTSFGNLNLNEAAPGGSATTKSVTLPYPFPAGDTNYDVFLEKRGAGNVWVTGKASSGFTLNYATTGGVPVSWKAVHAGQ